MESWTLLLITPASSAKEGPSTGVSEGGWNDAIAINLTGSFLGAKHQIAEMLKHGAGSIIFTSTFVGYSFAFPG